MFCLFFTGQEIINLDSVMTADTSAFRKFFTSMLEQGVYLAPSPYETGFISLAHSEDDIAKTLEAMDVALAAS
jgi:glutamate-1-semialdehyde 2,1-aminomutase